MDGPEHSSSLTDDTNYSAAGNASESSLAYS